MTSLIEYDEFLQTKLMNVENVGFDVPEVRKLLFGFQADGVKWAARRGRAAIFYDTGLGKTIMQLELARLIHEHTGRRVLILTPLAVAQQTEAKAIEFDYDARYAVDQADVDSSIVITNYEKLHRFDASQFDVLLDESSILKSLDGKTKTRLIETFARTPYRYCFTATPAPNDHMELGNTCEFLGIMTREEMLAMFFVHDGGATSQWRLKGHAEAIFWKWVSTWAVMVKHPRDLGYEDARYDLPPLEFHTEIIAVDNETTFNSGSLFPQMALTLADQRAAKRRNQPSRLERCAEIIYRSLGITYGDNETGEAARVYANVGREESSEDQNVSRQNEGEAERAASGAVRIAGGSQNQATHPINGVATEQSGEKEESETTAVRNQLPGISGDVQTAGLQVRDLRIQQHIKEAHFPDAGSLPYDREGSGDIVPELQSRSRQVSGRHRTSQESNLLSGERQPEEQWLIWCELNDEQDKLEWMFGDLCVSIQGRTSDEDKIERERQWREGGVPILISKPKVFGFGMNWQHCHNIAFIGVTHSYEQFYQCIRRCWRFGQDKPVHVWMFAGDEEMAVVMNLQRKQAEADKMSEAMVQHAGMIQASDTESASKETAVYQRDVMEGETWKYHLGDCIEVSREIPSDSIHYSIFSPPFASLYTYSNSERDMGNSTSGEEFAEHFQYLVAELFRMAMPGRLVSFHCMNLPATITHDGYIGIKDFRGELIKMFQAEGFIYHSEVCIWKDPVTAMQRTKAIGLLHKQLKKDSCISRQGIADYLVTMRKPGENPERVTKYGSEEEMYKHLRKINESEGDMFPRWNDKGEEITEESQIEEGKSKIFPVELWQRYASPVWDDIDAGDTLQYRAARDSSDERHICPLQLGVIRRGIQLWTNPGDVVFSPFGGIASEGYVALEMGRRFLGVELKKSYWEQGVRNLRAAEQNANALELLPINQEPDHATQTED